MRRRATPCGRCEKAVGRADSGLKCKWCHVLFHAECEGIPQGLQQALAEYQDQDVWYCTACQGELKASVTRISKLERINRELEERIKEVEAREEGRGNEEVRGADAVGERSELAETSAVAHAVAEGDGVRPRVDLNVMKRNMTIAKGFLDVCLLSANANQLKNVINFGDSEGTLYYWILSGITLSLILQVAAGVLLIVAERFDINKEEEQERGDYLNTMVTCLIFLVLIINVFVSSLGVDVGSPLPHHYHDDFTPTIPTTASDVFKDHIE